MRVLLSVLLISLSSTAFAEAVKTPEFKYAPSSCDFEIIFPEKFYKAEKCTSKNISKTDCYDVISYAKNIKDSSVDVRLTCESKTKEEIEILKQSDLKISAFELAKSTGLRSYGEDMGKMPDGTVTAVTIALGMRGKKEAIYTGQYWVGDKSLLTLEAEMTGPANDQIETIYSEILGSVKKQVK
jgi:hypothetical protein